MMYQGLKFDHWCDICKNRFVANNCEGCQSDMVDPEHIMPSKFNCVYIVRKNKVEDKKMIVTIIGSLSRQNRIKEAKKIF